MDKNNFYAVIMAGGKGERFWPQSRTSTPKPLLRIVGDLTLIEQTVERLKSVVLPENIFIITNRDYVPPMKSLLSDIPQENIIGEPMGKDTAPCIALAVAVVSAKSGSKNPVMGIFPADHVIKDVESFAKVIIDSADLAEKGEVVTIGVNPTYPSTGYGYIHCGNSIPTNSKTRFYKGLGFKEKPDPGTAQKFLADGSYKWNAGMFIWSVSTIMDAFKKFAPDLESATENIRKSVKTGKLIETVEKEYLKLRRNSIDYAVMEKITNLAVAECSFSWDDVGSWTALKNQIRPSENNNCVRGLHSGLNTNDCIIVGDNNHLISTIDVDDMIIVHTDDVTLVCKTHSAQRLKELLKQMSSDPKFSKYL
jgi:mannose-1-phosphate guanylyltransferase